MCVCTVINLLLDALSERVQCISLLITMALHGRLFSVTKIFVIDSLRPASVVISNEIY
jgi:hypothetical protein